MRQIEVHADPLPAVAQVGAALLRVLTHGGESTAITLRPLGDHIVTGIIHLFSTACHKKPGDRPAIGANAGRRLSELQIA
jgi:hypothetical protein